VIIIDNRPVYTTLEPPWKDNKRDISCIPPGIYRAVKMFSNKFKKMVFVLQDVPGRDLIEFHVGNKVENTDGCILLGMSFNKTEDGILESLNAFNDWMKRMPDTFTVTITDVAVDAGVTWV
jgi:hypothetical protein